MSGTSSLFPVGSIRLSGSIVEMKRYGFVFDCVHVSCWRCPITVLILSQVPAGLDVTAACVEALTWACRFLPFSSFLNVEEMLQDLLLSLLSELPSISLVSFQAIWNYTALDCPEVILNLIVLSFQVAETLLRAFPEEEESVRVPLREKYKSLLQRVKQGSVLGMNFTTSHFSLSAKTAFFSVMHFLRKQDKNTIIVIFWFGNNLPLNIFI